MGKQKGSYIADKIDKEYRRKKQWEEKLKRQKENKN